MDKNWLEQRNYRITRARAEAKKIMARTIVLINKIFSTPRLARKTAPSPPKTDPNPEPRCWRRMAMIRRTAEIN